MGIPTRDELEQIRARHAAATPGPYKWRWCHGSNAPELMAPRHCFLVMDAVRKGMGGAVIRFAERTDSMGGLMFKLSELCKMPGHREPEYIEVGNPDAAAMAHSWQDIQDLLDMLDAMISIPPASPPRSCASATVPTPSTCRAPPRPCTPTRITTTG